MNTSEVLNKAADDIERYGHTKGTAYGDGPVATAPACTIGAINRACMDGWIEDRDDSGRAKDAMAEFLAPTGIVNFNDHPDRTAADVVAALRAAALIEQARETSRESAPATERESVSS